MGLEGRSLYFRIVPFVLAQHDSLDTVFASYSCAASPQGKLLRKHKQASAGDGRRNSTGNTSMYYCSGPSRTVTGWPRDMDLSNDFCHSWKAGDKEI
jgi:hypothetical protein